MNTATQTAQLAKPVVPALSLADAQSRYITDCDDVMNVLLSLPDNSFHGCLTDPPYGISFMGKQWDHGVPSVHVWREVLRVLKPGAMLLAFGGTRTWHRLACNIEDAGFEIRDMLMYMYGSGFPKSHDVSKGIDGLDKRDAKLKFVAWMCTTGIEVKVINDRLKAKGLISSTSNFAVHFFNDGQPSLPNRDYWETIQSICDEQGIVPPDDIEEYIDLRIYGSRQLREREVVGSKMAGCANPSDTSRHTIGGSSAVNVDITAPSTLPAQQWDGYGTALKPAWEPIILAMKPLRGTFASNALEHGVSGINVDECRVEHNEDLSTNLTGDDKMDTGKMGWGYKKVSRNNVARWPANTIHDGSAEVVEGFPVVMRKDENGNMVEESASRFFYCAKTSSRERHLGNINCRHPTLKPIRLTTYLAALIRPPLHIPANILIPYSGAGSEAIGALKAGWHSAYLIDNNEQYCNDADARILAAMQCDEFNWSPVKRDKMKAVQPSSKPSVFNCR